MGSREAALLRCIAEKEALKSTQKKLGMTRAELKELLTQLADQVDTPAAYEGDARQRPGATAQRLRVYSDGAARGNPGLAGAGAVLVQPSGQVVDRIGKFLGVQTNNFAEYTGLLIGLRRARELGVKEVEVFADSELMIRQLGGRYQVKSPSLRPLYEEALKLMNDFTRVKLVHVPRAMNAAADEMSNRAIDERL